MKLTKYQEAGLRRLLFFCEMGPDAASFDRIHDDGDLPKTEKEADAFIKERTRLWRETWVLPIIRALLGEPPGVAYLKRIQHDGGW